MRRSSSASSGGIVNLVIAVIIIAVLAVGGVAVYQKVSDNMLDKAISEGTAENNVKTAARQAGQTVEEFLDYYGVKDSDLNGKSSVEDFVNKLSLGNFAKYQGEEFEEFVNEYGLTDKGLTEDTPWTDAEKLIPLGIYIGDASQIDSFKEFYGLDESVTADTPWGDVAEIVEAKNEELQNATPVPEADTAEDTADTAEDTTAGSAAEAPSEAETNAAE